MGNALIAVTLIGAMAAAAIALKGRPPGMGTLALRVLAMAAALGATGLSALAAANGQPGWAAALPVTLGIIAAAHVACTRTHTILWGLAIMAAMAASAMNGDTPMGDLIRLAVIINAGGHTVLALDARTRGGAPMGRFDNRQLAALLGMNSAALAAVILR